MHSKLAAYNLYMPPNSYFMYAIHSEGKEVVQNINTHLEWAYTYKREVRGLTGLGEYTYIETHMRAHPSHSTTEKATLNQIAFNNFVGATRCTACHGVSETYIGMVFHSPLTIPNRQSANSLQPP